MSRRECAPHVHRIVCSCLCFAACRFFHGTRVTDPRSVCLSSVGLDPRCSGDQRYYGNGVYFAANASYVDANYAHHLPGGIRQMFLAHVLCGKVYDYGLILDKELRRPPCITGTTKLYDSVKVCMNDGMMMMLELAQVSTSICTHRNCLFFFLHSCHIPQGGPHQGSPIHVVYSIAQSYPTYILTYKKHAT